MGVVIIPTDLLEFLLSCSNLSAVYMYVYLCVSSVCLQQSPIAMILLTSNDLYVTYMLYSIHWGCLQGLDMYSYSSLSQEHFMLASFVHLGWPSCKGGGGELRK